MEQPLFKLYDIVYLPAIKAMNGNRGRMRVQAGHGFVHAIFDAMDRFPEDLKAYRAQPSAFKISLVVTEEEELRHLYAKYQSICGVSLVEEKGNKSDGSVNTAVRGITGLGIGPLRIDLIGEDLASLPSFK